MQDVLVLDIFVLSVTDILSFHPKTQTYIHLTVSHKSSANHTRPTELGVL